MKKISSLILAISLLITACNNNKDKETTIISKDGTEKVTIDPKNMMEAAEDMQKKKEELSKLAPLNSDQFKALMPEQLMGATRSDLGVESAMGTSIASANYKINDDKEIKLTLIDCAGSGGAGIYSMQYLGMFNIQQDDEDEYTKTIDFNGGKAFENCKKTRPECTLTYFAGGRFLITMEGDNLGIEELKQAARALNIK